MMCVFESNSSLSRQDFVNRCSRRVYTERSVVSRTSAGQMMANERTRRRANRNKGMARYRKKGPERKGGRETENITNRAGVVFSSGDEGMPCLTR
jgi:hypothetical protein